MTLFYGAFGGRSRNLLFTILALLNGGMIYPYSHFVAANPHLHRAFQKSGKILSPSDMKEH